MPRFVVEKIQNALNDDGKPLKDSQIHIMGAAYKKDIADVRESPALDILHLLYCRGARISYTDPYVESLRTDHIELSSVDERTAVPQADCVVIVTDHKSFDYKRLVDSAKLIVDSRNALRGFRSDKIVRL